MKPNPWVLVLTMALSGCTRFPSRSPSLDAPPSSDEERLKDSIQAAEQRPTRWSLAVTVTLYPVLLVADATLKFGRATGNSLLDLILGQSHEPLTMPERVERQVERLSQKQ